MAIAAFYLRLQLARYSLKSFDELDVGARRKEVTLLNPVYMHFMLTACRQWCQQPVPLYVLRRYHGRCILALNANNC